MSKNIYYEVEYRIREKFLNNGFLIATIDNGELVKSHGVFTNDFITLEPTDENMINLKVYSPKNEFTLSYMQLVLEVKIPNEYIEFPVNLMLNLTKEGQTDELSLITRTKVIDIHRQVEISNQLLEFLTTREFE